MPRRKRCSSQTARPSDLRNKCWRVVASGQRSDSCVCEELQARATSQTPGTHRSRCGGRAGDETAFSPSSMVGENWNWRCGSGSRLQSCWNGHVCLIRSRVVVAAKECRSFASGPPLPPPLPIPAPRGVRTPIVQER